MIRPLEMSLVEAAGWAHSGMIIQLDGPGLYSGDEKKHR